MRSNCARPPARATALPLRLIEGLASERAQLQRVPANPHNEVRLATACHQESLEGSDPDVVAIANPDLARQRDSALKRLGAMLVGQFQV